jgi:hypothetical protein
MDRTDYTGFKNGNGEKIITNRIGELVHIDCRQLSKGITPARPGRTYHHPGRLTVTVARRVEVVEDKKTLTVMFVTLKAFNILRRQYGPEVEAMITDSGAEFGSGPAAKNRGEHPFERLLPEWPSNTVTPVLTARKLTGKRSGSGKPFKEDFIEEALCEDMDDLKNELSGFLVCYNEHGPHSAIGNIPPAKRLNM